MNRRLARFLGFLLFIVSSIVGVAENVQAYGTGPWTNVLGPGGGTVYYYSAAGFNCGVNLTKVCNYLEVAGTGWSAANRFWDSTKALNVSGTSQEIGTGAKNTALIVAGNSTLGYAATDTNAYVSSTGIDDWFLPSLKEAQSLDNANYSTAFGEVGTSSQVRSDLWHTYDSNNNVTPGDSPKREAFKILAIRAFGKSDSSLANLQVSSETLSPSFDPTVLEYTVTTSRSTIQITPAAVGASSTLVGLQSVANGQPSSSIALATGSNQVVLRATAADGTSTSYTVNIIKTVAITYDGNGSTGGSVPSAQNKTTGVALTVASNSGSLVKAGYTFAGWNTQANGSGTSYAVESSYAVEASLTLYAQWTANTLTVTYDSQLGSAITAGSTTTGGSISASPGAPSRTGYTFTGWFTATSGGIAISFPYTHGRTANFTLYAQWTVMTFSVTFNGNGHTGGSVPSAQTKTYGVALTLATNTGSLVKTGYTFAGWNTLANGSGTSYAVGSSYAVDASVSLYAQWTANTLTVTYNSQLGSAITAGSTTTGSSIAASPGTPTRTGYTFTGWFAAATGGVAISFPYTHGRTTNFTLYAQWTVATYPVTFDGNGNTGGSVPSAQAKTYGVALTLASNSGSLVKAGYTFAGWNTQANGLGTSYAVEFSYAVEASLTLYAQWTANTLTVTYDSQLGSAITAGSTTTGSSIAASPGTPTRTGYTFTGWFTAASGGVAILFPYTHGRTASFTLYAQWTANALTITYDSQLGTAITAGSTTTGGSILASPGTPSRTGYEFAGWFAAASVGTEILFPYTHGRTASFTLFAQWTANALTVTYESQLGSAITAGSTTTGGAIATSPGTPSRTGYEFAGWFAASSGGAAISFPYTHGRTASFTLFAQWTANALTVTYDSQLGTAITAGSTTTGGSILASPGTPSRTGYTFTGWFASATGGTEILFPYTHGRTASFTLFAQWTANALTVTYDSQLGSAITAGSTTTGGSIASPGTPSRTGYEFAGWFTAASGGAAISFPYTHGRTASFTLFAQWTANALTVTYDSQLGSAITAGSTTTGGAIATSPGTPSRTGYEFVGWFTASSGGGAISFPYAHGQTSNFVLYAQWTANALTITYDSQLGSAITAGSTTTGGSILASPGTPSRTGYEFAGWFAAASGGTEILFPYTHGRTASFTLYAQWTTNALTITYDSQLGSAITAGSTNTGGSISASPGTPSRTGYEFAGWFAAASGGVAILFPYTHGRTASFTLYAQWTANALTVTYDSQLGSAITAGSTTTGSSIASPGTPSRTGHEFAGWFASATGGTEILFPYTHGRTASFTLYAQWTANALTVTYDSQLGSAITAGSTNTGGSISASPGTPSRTGYEFVGWFTASSGGAAISFPYTHGRTASFTLFAQWTANALTITYDSQLGTAITAGSTTTGGSILASPGTPSRTGYTFTGWFASATGGTAISFPYVHEQTTNFIRYAQWTQTSLYGLGSKTKIGTITTANGVGNTFAAETAVSSVSLRYPADGLPAGTVIDVYLVNDLSRASNLIERDGGFVISLVVAWVADDGSVPLTAADKPISMTIANTTIKAGAKTYAILGGVVTLIGTATTDGTVTVLIYEDPEIVVVNPMAIATPAAKPIVVAPAPDAVSAPAAPAVTPPVAIPAVVTRSWSITFLPYVASVFRNNQVAWTAFASSQGSSVLSCSITGVSPSEKSKANNKLFENRQTSLITMLKYNGCEKVAIRTPSRSTQSATINRTWKVDVEPSASAIDFNWTHDFKTYSSVVDRKQVPQWSAFIADKSSAALSCLITGVEPLTKSKANTQLFDKRSESLKAYLLSNGCASVQMSKPIGRKEKLASRTIWKVAVDLVN